MQLLLSIAILCTPALTACHAEGSDRDVVKRRAAPVSEALDNLRKARSFRFSCQQVLRHNGRIAANVETSGEWLVGKASRVSESVWMGDRTFTTNTIVAEGACYVQSEGEEKWWVTKAAPEELTPQVVLDLPLYLKATKGYTPGKDTTLKDVPCRVFGYEPILPPGLNIKTDSASARVLISRTSRTIAEVSVEATGRDEAKDPVTFSCTVRFFDHDEPLKILPPSTS